MPQAQAYRGRAVPNLRRRVRDDHLRVPPPWLLQAHDVVFFDPTTIPHMVAADGATANAEQADILEENARARAELDVHARQQLMKGAAQEVNFTMREMQEADAHTRRMLVAMDRGAEQAANSSGVSSTVEMFAGLEGILKGK